jgi:hypothetical protein
METLSSLTTISFNFWILIASSCSQTKRLRYLLSVESLDWLSSTFLNPMWSLKLISSLMLSSPMPMKSYSTWDTDLKNRYFYTISKLLRLMCKVIRTKDFWSQNCICPKVCSRSSISTVSNNSYWLWVRRFLTTLLKVTSSHILQIRCWLCAWHMNSCSYLQKDFSVWVTLANNSWNKSNSWSSSILKPSMMRIS